MVPIGGKPILWHIMEIYARFSHKDFYIALGYKAEVIKEYFLNYRALNSDFSQLTWLLVQFTLINLILSIGRLPLLIPATPL